MNADIQIGAEQDKPLDLMNSEEGIRHNVENLATTLLLQGCIEFIDDSDLHDSWEGKTVRGLIEKALSVLTGNSYEN